MTLLIIFEKFFHCNRLCDIIFEAEGARSSAAERAAHNRLVEGSNPSGPTN